MMNGWGGIRGTGVASVEKKGTVGRDGQFESKSKGRGEVNGSVGVVVCGREFEVKGIQ
jgi:hypothetical protein